jgi:hypothetical protein
LRRLDSRFQVAQKIFVTGEGGSRVFFNWRAVISFSELLINYFASNRCAAVFFNIDAHSPCQQLLHQAASLLPERVEFPLQNIDFLIGRIKTAAVFFCSSRDGSFNLICKNSLG